MTTPISAPTARFGYCSKCGRALSHLRSNAHGMGPCCWKLHLESLSPDDRARETMRGYNWFKAADLYIVVAPEHHTYQVDPDKPVCECIAFTAGGGKPCKHILYIRREIGWTAPEGPETPQDGQETAPAPEVDSFRVELGNKHNPPGYAVVRGDGKAYRVNWQRPFCNCPYFTNTHEICIHIRAAQDAVNQQRQAQQARGETLEARRARVQADIDEIFDER